MQADPLLITAGQWLGVAGGGLTLLTVGSFVARWGIRFRLVGVTSFTLLLAFSCVAFAISYSPRVAIPGAVSVPVVFDNGTDLVVATAPDQLEPAAFAPTVEQVARNLHGNARNNGTGLVRVRLRRIEAVEPGLGRPVVLAEAVRQLADGTVEVTLTPHGA
ncbi:Ycf51 family protein [Cyanobium sp. Morenito 9A2]|uniref:Ycf51 family protein n=1 Tax=Cyanobium sp. Morenito 9A2 TaxID=2823718 RepID=UPI0020CF48BA|nr:Ycf51 family protein [Cyanobium sp. Morenito 9A2]MCP9849380.1 Ycf51 family protein [Cyanobium sp. Morenito 9A2]